MATRCLGLVVDKIPASSLSDFSKTYPFSGVFLRDRDGTQLNVYNMSMTCVLYVGIILLDLLVSARDESVMSERISECVNTSICKVTTGLNLNVLWSLFYMMLFTMYNAVT